MKPSFKLCSALVVAFAAVGMAHADAPKYVLKLAHADSTDLSVSRKAVMAQVFQKEVEAKSHGQIKVEVFGGGALGGEKQYVEGVKNGFIQAGLASAVVADYFPPAMVTDIPYLFPSTTIADKVMDGPFGKKLSAEFEAKTGMINLCFGEVGYRDFTSGKKPIESPADLKGMKIRVMESPVYVTEMKALGAQPTPVAWPETYSALQTGVVDGEENPVPSVLSAKFYEVQKYLTLDGHNYGVDWFVMNGKFYNGLPANLQAVVRSAAQDSCDAERRVNRKFTADDIKVLEQKGMTVYTPTAAQISQFRADTQKPVADWISQKVGAQWVDGVLAAVKSAEAGQ